MGRQKVEHHMATEQLTEKQCLSNAYSIPVTALDAEDAEIWLRYGQWIFHIFKNSSLNLRN